MLQDGVLTFFKQGLERRHPGVLVRRGLGCKAALTNPPVLDPHNPVGSLGDVGIVGNHHNGLVKFPAAHLQQLHHVVAGLGVQISRRLYTVSTEEEPPAGGGPLVVLLFRYYLYVLIIDISPQRFPPRFVHFKFDRYSFLVYPYHCSDPLVAPCGRMSV